MRKLKQAAPLVNNAPVEVRVANLDPDFLMREMTRTEARALLPEEKVERRRLKNNEKTRRFHATNKQVKNTRAREAAARLPAEEKEKRRLRKNEEDRARRSKAAATGTLKPRQDTYSAEKREAYNDAYYAENRDKILSKKTLIRQSKPGYKPYVPRSVEERKLLRKESSREWAKKNSQRVLEGGRRRRAKNPEAAREKSRRYYANHPDAPSIALSKRRARARGTEGSYTEKEWRELLTQYDNRCGYCGEKPLDGKRLAHEHRTPLSRGGSNYISNLIPACQRCNNRKFTLTEEEYRELLQREARGEFVYWGRDSLQKNFANKQL